MRLGTMDIPNYPLAETVELVKKIYEQLKRDEITREHIAGILGFNARSGGFNMRLFDMKLYGLIDGRAKFRVTDLAVKATFGTEEEKALALDAAVRNVPLWKAFYEKWGTSIPPDTFWIDLATMAGVERSESKSEADKVRKLYMEDVKYVLSASAPNKPVDPPVVPPIGGGARGRKEKMAAEAFCHSIPGWGSAEISVTNLKYLKSLREYLDSVEEALSEKTETQNIQSLDLPDEPIIP